MSNSNIGNAEAIAGSICLAGGNNTIGYGHEIKSSESYTEITEKKAQELLATDLKWFEDGINKNYSGKTTLSQNQFDALVSLGFNIGRGALVNSSIFKLAENGETDSKKILDAFLEFNSSDGIVLDGLKKRRYDEAEMYLYGDYSCDNDFTLDEKKVS